MTPEALKKAIADDAPVWAYSPEDHRVRRCHVISVSTACVPEGRASLLPKGDSLPFWENTERVHRTPYAYWCAVLAERRDFYSLVYRAPLMLASAPQSRPVRELVYGFNRDHSRVIRRLAQLERAENNRFERAMAARAYRTPMLGERVRFHGNELSPYLFYDAEVIDSFGEHPNETYTLRVFPPPLFLLPADPYDVTGVRGATEATLGHWTHYPVRASQ